MGYLFRNNSKIVQDHLAEVHHIMGAPMLFCYFYKGVRLLGLQNKMLTQPIHKGGNSDKKECAPRGAPRGSKFLLLTIDPNYEGRLKQKWHSLLEVNAFTMKTKKEK